MSPTVTSSRLPGLAVFILLVVTTACYVPGASGRSNAIPPAQRPPAAGSVALPGLNTALEPLISLAKGLTAPL